MRSVIVCMGRTNGWLWERVLKRDSVWNEWRIKYMHIHTRTRQWKKLLPNGAAIIHFTLLYSFGYFSTLPLDKHVTQYIYSEWVWILVFPCHGKYRKELRTQLLWQGKNVCCKRKKSNELIYIFFLLSLPSSHFFSVLFAHFSWRFCCFLCSLPNLLWENECCNFGAMPVCNSNNCLH